MILKMDISGTMLRILHVQLLPTINSMGGFRWAEIRNRRVSQESYLRRVTTGGIFQEVI